MSSIFTSKRYKDIFEQYIYKNEKTPFTLGTLVVCCFCFLLLIISTFYEASIPVLHFEINDVTGLQFSIKTINYTPRIPAMIFIIYLLGRNYSIFVFSAYLLVGLFIWPIFVFGGGISYVQNYLFGYFLGFLVAIFITGNLLNKSQDIKTKLIAGTLGVLSIHLTGLLYSIILAIFRVIEFNLIIPIVFAISGTNILYDILFSILVLIIGPYIKNVFWVCMKPKPDKKKHSKNN